jgi:hypothetical protein
MKLHILKKMARGTATVVGTAVITAVVVSGTLSVAQAASEAVAENVPNNSVNSAKIVNGSVQGVDIKDATITGADIADGGVTTFDISDNTIGPGDLNVNLRPRWARINGGASPSVLAGRNVTSVAHQGVGVYRVSFNRDVSACSYTATLTDNANGVANPGEIAIERGTAVNDVWVRTYTSTGAAADTASGHGFTLAVYC